MAFFAIGRFYLWGVHKKRGAYLER